MEEKIVGKKGEESSLSFHISFTLVSIASLSPVIIYSALDLSPHSGSPTTQDPVFALKEQYSTGQSDPYE